MAKSIPGGVEIVNTLSTKNDGNYPLVKAESVGMADGTTAEDNIKKKLDKNQGTQNNGKFMRVGADGNLVPDDVPIPDVSGQIKEHNENTDSHQDIRTELKKKANSGTTLSDYGITDAVPDSHLTDSKAHEDIRKETAKLKEDLGNQKKAINELADKKITKFYASNQGEIHIADSDNGKIQDMMIYGQSSQIKTTGKNKLKIKDTTSTTRGIVITSKDGIITVNGTATENGYALLEIDTQTVADGTYIVNYEAYNHKNDIRLILLDAKYKRVIEQNKATSLSNAEISKIAFDIREGQTYDMKGVKIQLELGSVATSYEPYTGGKPSPNPDYPQEIKRVVNPTVKVKNEDGLKVQSVTLNNITLNAIHVSSGGNVTIDGQQYIADYVDVERGKLVRRVDSSKLDNAQSIIDKMEWLLAEQQETNLTTEQAQALKELATYYHVTNISVTSDQLDGYAVFNYPISLANGWNYVKQQLNDNRDYIYDMDIQSAEAYVNSEYAVTLIELGV